MVKRICEITNYDQQPFSLSIFDLFFWLGIKGTLKISQ